MNTPRPDSAQVAKALELLQPIKDKLGLPRTGAPTKFYEEFSAQLEAVIEAKAVELSLAFLVDVLFVSALLVLFALGGRERNRMEAGA